MGKSPLQTPLLAPAPLDLPPQTPGLKPDGSAPQSAHRPEHAQQHFETVQLPHGLTADEFSRAFEIVASAAPALRPHAGGAPLHRASSHVREVSAPQHGKEEEAGGHGGHDAPNWSRTKSATVLLACTVLYAIIAGASVPDCSLPLPADFPPTCRDPGRRRGRRSRRLCDS